MDSLCEITLFNILVFVRLYTVLNSQVVAKTLQVPPSKISRALASLRQNLGDPLFIRRQYGFQATPMATRIFPEMERLLQHAQALARQLQPASEERQRVVLSVPAPLRAGLTQHLNFSCRRHEAAIDVVTRTWSGPVTEEMGRNQVDIGVFCSQQGYPKMGSELVAENRATYLVGAADHEIWKEAPLTLEALLRYPQVVTEMTEINDEEDMLERAARALGRELIPVARVNSLAELVEMVVDSPNLSQVCGSQAVGFLRSVHGIRVQRLPEEVRETVLRLNFGERVPGFHMLQRTGHRAPPWLVESVREFVRDAAELID
ncbi:LysR family transcriptional regulator [Ferrimonas sediminicola]|nr:LysR family transcriptional regulator [Ferrimonas sediminicola]